MCNERVVLILFEKRITLKFILSSDNSNFFQRVKIKQMNVLSSDEPLFFVFLWCVFKYFSIDFLDDGTKEDLRSLFIEVIDWIEESKRHQKKKGVQRECFIAKQE